MAKDLQAESTRCLRATGCGRRASSSRFGSSFSSSCSRSGPICRRSIEIVCWIAAIVLLLFNTASIAAMVRHYAHDKEHIYGVDIKHLDAGR